MMGPPCETYREGSCRLRNHPEHPFPSCGLSTNMTNVDLCMNDDFASFFSLVCCGCFFKSPYLDQKPRSRFNLAFHESLVGGACWHQGLDESAHEDLVVLITG